MNAIDLTGDDDDNAPSTGGVKGGTAKRGLHETSGSTQGRVKRVLVSPKSVFVVMRCNIPLQNQKWGEHAGHETEDSEILGIFTKSKDVQTAELRKNMVKRTIVVRTKTKATTRMAMKSSLI
jgi:hypothetical protein